MLDVKGLGLLGGVVLDGLPGTVELLLLWTEKHNTLAKAPTGQHGDIVDYFNNSANP
jgi:hypothetical protein